jgi:aconitate hydratase
MTTETTCLSSIWTTDSQVKEFYDIHGRPEEYKELNPGEVAYYDGVVYVDLDKVKPMIAMPFHPSNTYTIEELNANLEDILADVEKKALVSLDGKIVSGRFLMENGFRLNLGQDMSSVVLELIAQ